MVLWGGVGDASLAGDRPQTQPADAVTFEHPFRSRKQGFG